MEKAMKTKNYSIDEMIENIQSMSVSDLKQIENSSEFIFQNNGEYPDSNILNDDIENNMDTLSDFIHTMSLSEIKSIPTIPINVDELTIEQKILLTGLEKWIIVRLETQKENATLKEIITYCEKLKIPFNRFIPELYYNNMVNR